MPQIYFCTCDDCDFVTFTSSPDSVVSSCDCSVSLHRALEIQSQAINRMPSPSEDEMRRKAADFFSNNSLDISMWPGPLAYEYKHLQTLMLDGNIEGACWKLFNFTEILTLFFLSTIIQLENLSISDIKSFNDSQQKKRGPGLRDIAGKRVLVEENCRKFKDNGIFLKKELFPCLREIAQWRNNQGPGHGTLSRHKINFITELISFMKTLWLPLSKMTTFLNTNNLSLYIDEDKPVVGPNYLVQHKGFKNDSILSVVKETKAGTGTNIQPVFFYGYQFDSTDIYFFNNFTIYGGETILNYRNFRTNRTIQLTTQYIDARTAGNFDSLQQVSLRDETKRQNWLDDLKGTEWDLDDRHRISKLLLSFAATFYQHGSFSETTALLKIITDYFGNTSGEGETIVGRKKILEALIILSSGKSGLPDVSKALQGTEKVVEPLPEKEKLSFFIELLWLYAAKRDVKNVGSLFGYLQEFKEVSLDGSKDLESAILAMKQEKNFLYGMRPLRDQRKNEHLHPSLHPKLLINLQERCLLLVDDILPLSMENPTNEVYADILGFACNLYCDFVEESWKYEPPHIQEKENLINKMESLILLGKKIRRNLHAIWPDDVWTVRGYAWSIHRWGRFQETVQRNLALAEEYYFAAQLIRQSYLEKFGRDKGLCDDWELGCQDLGGRSKKTTS